MKRWLIALALVCAVSADAQHLTGGLLGRGGSSSTATYATLTAPVGCVAGSVGLFLGSPVAMGCDAGISYDAPTDTLTAGKAVLGNGTVSAPSLSFAGSTAKNSGIYFVDDFTIITSSGGETFRSGSAYNNLNRRLVFIGPGTYDTAFYWVSSGLLRLEDGGGNKRDLTARDVAGDTISAGHLIGVGTVPSVVGNGTTPGTIAGTDTAAKVTVGTGTTTSIVITYAVPFATAPVVICNAQTTTTPINVTSTQTTATLTTSAFTPGEVLQVMSAGF